MKHTTYTLRLFFGFDKECFATVEATILPRIGESFYINAVDERWFRLLDLSYSCLNDVEMIDCLVELRNDEWEDEE